jgi:hypothetical protein
MALVMGITLPAGMEIVYNKTIRMYDISVLCNVGKNPVFFPRDKFYTLREITYLFQIAYAWGLFSVDTKNEWNLAANIIGEHNYNLFVQDKSYRIKNGIGGNSTPSIYHQYLVGHLSVANPATGAFIAQYNTKRVNFPASFEINFKTNLVSAGEGSFARLRFIWTRYTSGQNIESTETIELPLVSGWDKRKQWITSYSGIRGKWRIELELYNVTGDIWFDNLFVTYSGEIKLNDPYCMDVVKWWKNLNPAEGVTFETVYPTGGAL